VGLYILVVGGLGSALQGQGNGLISLLFTGLIAVLFHPLRERLQGAVNYLVYGKRNDPYQVLSQLSRRLETALVLDETLSTIVETIAQAFKLPYAAIMLKQGEREEPGAVYGQVRPEDRLLRLALTYQGEMLGELVLSTGPSGETYSARDQRLLEDLVRHAGTAVHAVHLHAAMRRSRELLVTAREEERRRLRRDLHDGLGPQLASLMLILTAGRKMVRSNAEAAEHMLTEAMTHLQEAINDIRRLVYGLRPPALDDLGLLATLQEDLRHYQMSGLACVLVVPDSLPSLPAAVEVACYRIVREALTNVLKHAQARRCIVQIKPGETLDLEVTDDGCGLPPGWKPGIGLTSLHERAQELGGTWNIEARPGGGTCVSAHLPWKYQATASNQQREKKPYGACALNHR
jgi:signal transduction histidine kinase